MITNGKNRTVLSQINVTPFVDVMLVLLIIFMVTAPMLQEGMDVKLPKVETSALLLSGDEPIIITIDKAGSIFVNKNRMVLSELKDKLGAIYKRKREKIVLLRADREVPYGYVVKTMAEIRRAGIERVGMMTEPPETER